MVRYFGILLTTFALTTSCVSSAAKNPVPAAYSAGTGSLTDPLSGQEAITEEPCPSEDDEASSSTETGEPEEVELPVRCLSIRGERIGWIAGAKLGASERVVIVDFGGPGSVESDIITSIEDLSLLQNDNSSTSLITIREPGAASLRDACHLATEDHLNNIRRVDFDASEAANWKQECKTESQANSAWLEELPSLTSHVLGASGAREWSFLGWSFASVRLAALLQSRELPPPNGWVLITPIDPYSGISLNLRAQRISEELRDMWQSGCRAESEACNVSLDDAVSASTARLPVSLSDRSVDFSPTDLGAALVGASYDPSNETWLHDDVEALSSGEPAKVQFLGEAADRVIGRYGSASYLRQMSEYLIGVCPFVQRQNGDPDSQALAPVGAFLLRLHLVCDGIPEMSLELAASPTSGGCVFYGEFDPIGVSGEEARSVWPSSSTVELAGSGHGGGMENDSIFDAVVDILSGGSSCGSTA